MVGKDQVWARRTLNRALLISFGLGLLTAVPLLLFGQQIIAIWVGSEMVPSKILLLGFSVWVLLSGYGSCMSVYLNSGPLLGKQIWFCTISALIAVILKIFLATHWQIAGVIWATVLGYGIFYVVPAARLAYGSFRVRELV